MALVTVSLTWADWLLKGHNIIVCSKYYAWELHGTARWNLTTAEHSTWN